MHLEEIRERTFAKYRVKSQNELAYALFDSGRGDKTANCGATHAMPCPRPISNCKPTYRPLLLSASRSVNSPNASTSSTHAM